MKKTKAFEYSIISAAAIVALCSSTSPFSAFADSFDLGCFYTVGDAMFGNVTLYRDIYEQKGPWLYLIYGLAAQIKINGAIFAGVYLMQVAAMSVFMIFSLKIGRLFYGAEKFPVWFAALLGALIESAPSLSKGGSTVEELALPLFAVSLYQLLKISRNEGNLIIFGALGGFFAMALFLMKFTLVGFYIAWFFIALRFTLKNNGKIWRLILPFAGGLIAASAPWLVYFGANGAMGDFFTVYFYNNMFLYGGAEKDVWKILRTVAAQFRANAQYFAPVFGGLIYFSYAQNPQYKGFRAAIWILFAATAFTVFAKGEAQAYYCHALAVFAVFGLFPFAGAIKQKPPALYRAAVSVIICAGLAFLAFNFTPNHNIIFRDRKDAPQLVFGDAIRAIDGENPTLLPYAFLDRGFYIGADITPTKKYFTRLNILGSEMAAAQKGYLKDGTIGFAVTMNGSLDAKEFPNYKPIMKMKYDYTFTLYANADMYQNLPEFIDKTAG